MVNTKKQNRIRRKIHTKKKTGGTAEKPRVFVFKSNKYLHAGVANDDSGVVILGGRAKRNTEGVEILGKKMATDMKKKKVDVAVFDRSGYKYHGIIAKFVESLRSNGIKI
ncbi:MAG: 50S ribosomal protein L18 [candidate division WS6 bacterium GW2011_GWF2_39_15]|uniref:50S ribosomal protein L18 n=1 Tax=candidate division WS6 bacterium GW2011_GWF2_39_15 TaxID=1619100 RepID=A0A0G0MYQ3_9BACT|nr:MAG: 50S ribosomal protein L18 [candidate division WS6 bacterium GW2011_GWF2_39_15]